MYWCRMALRHGRHARLVFVQRKLVLLLGMYVMRVVVSRKLLCNIQGLGILVPA